MNEIRLLANDLAKNVFHLHNHIRTRWPIRSEHSVDIGALLDALSDFTSPEVFDVRFARSYVVAIMIALRAIGYQHSAPTGGPGSGMSAGFNAPRRPSAGIRAARISVVDALSAA